MPSKSNKLTVKNNSLYCILCNQKLTHERKSSILTHFGSKSHKKAEEKKKAREQIVQSILNLDPATLKTNFATDLVKAFTRANIPLQKLEQESIVELF